MKLLKPLALLAAGCIPLLGGTAIAATYTVTSTADSLVPGTLRRAIHDANLNPGSDTIEFNIAGGGVKTITLNALLGRLNVLDPVEINGTSQPGYSGSPLIELNCNGISEGFMVADAPGGDVSGTSILGFTINRYSTTGIHLYNGEGHTIENCWIGTNAAGNASQENVPETVGILLFTSNNSIVSNTISGTFNGIVVGNEGESTTPIANNFIGYNKIGTDPSGTFGIGNYSDGIFLTKSATTTFIGPDNVISGNASAGIEIYHPSTHYTIVFGNRIGTNGGGTYAIPNADQGVLIGNYAYQNYIGAYNLPNTISGNFYAGVTISNFPSNGVLGGGWANWVSGNLIGCSSDGSSPIGNTYNGIEVVGDTSTFNIILSNFIVANGRWGIYLEDSFVSYIYSNTIGWTPPLGNGYDGVLFSNSSYNDLIGNTIVFNGSDIATFSGWMAYREINGSVFNNIFNNAMSNNGSQFY